MFALWLSALLHLYIGWRIAPELPGPVAPWAFSAVLLASAILIPLAFFGRRSRDRAKADRYSWAGMLALGAVVHAAGASRCCAMACCCWRGRSALPALPEQSALAVPLLAALFMAIGIFNARRTARVREVEVPVAKACRRRCTASRSRRSATSTSARRSSAPTCRRSSTR